MSQVLVASIVLLWIVVLGNLVLTLALVRRLSGGGAADGQAVSAAGLEAGQRAPDFTARWVDGGEVRRDDFRGREVAFIFIAPGCVPCEELVPRLEAIAPDVARAGAELVVVCAADVEPALDLARRVSLTLPLISAPRDANPFLQDYRVGVTPHYCVVSTEGVVRDSGIPNERFARWRELAAFWKARAAESRLSAAP